MKRNLLYLGGLGILLWGVAAQLWIGAARNSFIEEATGRYEAVAETIGALGPATGELAALEQTLSAFLEKDSDLRGITWAGGGVRLDIRTAEGDDSADAGNARGLWLEFPVEGRGALSGTLGFEYSEQALSRKVQGVRIRLYAVTTLILLLLTGGAYMVWKLMVQRPLKDFLSEIAGVVGVEPADSRSRERELLAALPRMLQRKIAESRDVGEKAAMLAAGIRAESLKAGASFESLSRDAKGESRVLDQAGNLISNLDASQRDIHESSEMLAALFDENVCSVLEMRSSMAEIACSADELFESTGRAYASVSKISDSSREISSGMADLSGTVDDAISALQELSASVRGVEESARDAAVRAAEVTERASGMGMAAVHETRDGMAKIEHEVSASANIMDRLGKRSKDITKVLGVIREVTEQTNLLSLNAAILAAQAGEQGRAFGVVADEIASLAERTAGSTQEISMIVAAIQKEIAEAIHSTARCMSRVQEGNILVGRTEEALSGMLEHARSSAEMALNIQRATVEQGEAIGHVGQSVARIQDMTQQVMGALVKQENGLPPLTGHVGTVRSVVDMLRKGTQEQHEGIRSISENMQHTNEKLSQIAEGTSPEKTVIPKLALVFQNMSQLSSKNEEALRRLGEQIRSLSALVDELYESTGSYRK